ncbi:MAG: DUF4391 domain-containing protein [Clostridia bacterium]|nr:DUF4391 domain-containing protein [Clostridia bacterium]
MSDLLKRVNADKQVRSSARSIQSITLVNAVSRERLNLPPLKDSDDREIYIMEVCLKDASIPVDFIAVLDKIIYMRTIYVLTLDNEYKLYAAYKAVRNGKLIVEKYRETDWLNEIPKIQLPTSISRVDEIYASLFDIIIPYKMREGESLKECLDRNDKITKLQRDIQSLQKKVDNEIQPKKRFEMNDNLKQMKSALAHLTQE